MRQEYDFCKLVCYTNQFTEEIKCETIYPMSNERVKRYWFSDGIGELIGGGLLMLLGIYFVLQQFLERFLTGNSITTLILQNGFFLLVFIGGWLIAQQLINFLNDLPTYPRTGYVEYQTNKEHNPKRKWILGAALALVSGVSAALIVMLAHLLQFFDALVALTGLMGAFVFMILRTRSFGLTRFYVLAGVSIVLGLVLSVSGLSISYNTGLFYGLMGICVSISGGWTLRRYLQHNPTPVEGE